MAQQNVIPPEALVARVRRAYRYARGRDTEHGMYAWFGERVGVTGQTAARWCSGELPVSSRVVAGLEKVEREVAAEMLAEAQRAALDVRERVRDLLSDNPTHMARVDITI
jgi:hypothetical protein